MSDTRERSESFDELSQVLLDGGSPVMAAVREYLGMHLTAVILTKPAQSDMAALGRLLRRALAADPKYRTELSPGFIANGTRDVTNLCIIYEQLRRLQAAGDGLSEQAVHIGHVPVGFADLCFQAIGESPRNPQVPFNVYAFVRRLISMLAGIHAIRSDEHADTDAPKSAQERLRDPNGGVESLDDRQVALIVMDLAGEKETERDTSFKISFKKWEHTESYYDTAKNGITSLAKRLGRLVRTRQDNFVPDEGFTSHLHEAIPYLLASVVKDIHSKCSKRQGGQTGAGLFGEWWLADPSDPSTALGGVDELAMQKRINEKRAVITKLCKDVRERAANSRQRMVRWSQNVHEGNPGFSLDASGMPLFSEKTVQEICNAVERSTTADAEDGGFAALNDRMEADGAYQESAIQFMSAYRIAIMAEENKPKNAAFRGRLDVLYKTRDLIPYIVPGATGPSLTKVLPNPVTTSLDGDVQRDDDVRLQDFQNAVRDYTPNRKRPAQVLVDVADVLDLLFQGQVRYKTVEDLGVQLAKLKKSDVCMLADDTNIANITTVLGVAAGTMVEAVRGRRR